ncbi:MAG: hypothetical protein ACKVJG_20385 [Candidatus Latescibacterota bacterium]|jgi:hypothetical protein|tara:strand:+ start:224 stop:688 length:465 start_codon:yes stop_codon:yes gene_type:complete
MRFAPDAIFDYVTNPLPDGESMLVDQRGRVFYHSDRDPPYGDANLRDLHPVLSKHLNSNVEQSAYAACELDGHDHDIRICPGNDKTADFLEQVSTTPSTDGSFSYRDIAPLFPGDFAGQLQRIRGGSEVVEVERVACDERYYRHTYTPFVDDRE